MSEDVSRRPEAFLARHRREREKLWLHDGLYGSSDRICRKSNASQNIESNPVTRNL